MTTSPKSPLRIIVIDDSATARELLVGILQMTEGVQVVGTGRTGEDAIRLTKRMKPDVLLMDINMPRLDGLAATREIMYSLPTPIVLVTGTMMHSDVNLSFKALNAGALTVMGKPGLGDEVACHKLAQTVKSMAQVPVVRRWSVGAQKPEPATPKPQPKTAPSTSIPSRNSLSSSELKSRSIIGIASSTGGPGALAKIFKPLPATFPLPILLVQHVTQGFAAGFAEWLNGETALTVRLAAHGEQPQPGVVLIAPDNYHLQVHPPNLLELFKAPPYHGLRPSANYLFKTMANVYGARALGIVLTGMGDDGAEGMETLHRSGGLTIAQDKKSCVVYGMPQEAVLRNAIDAVLSLDEIAETLRTLCG